MQSKVDRVGGNGQSLAVRYINNTVQLDVGVVGQLLFKYSTPFDHQSKSENMGIHVGIAI